MIAGLTRSDMAEIDAVLEVAAAGVPPLPVLRARFPRLSITRVDASDLGIEEPFKRYKLFDLHLVDGNSHCWSLTDNPGQATGLVLAARGSAS